MSTLEQLRAALSIESWLHHLEQIFFRYLLRVWRVTRAMAIGDYHLESVGEPLSKPRVFALAGCVFATICLTVLLAALGMPTIRGPDVVFGPDDPAKSIAVIIRDALFHWALLSEKNHELWHWFQFVPFVACMVLPYSGAIICDKLAVKFEPDVKPGTVFALMGGACGLLAVLALLLALLPWISWQIFSRWGSTFWIWRYSTYVIVFWLFVPVAVLFSGLIRNRMSSPRSRPGKAFLWKRLGAGIVFGVVPWLLAPALILSALISAVVEAAKPIEIQVEASPVCADVLAKTCRVMLRQTSGMRALLSATEPWSVSVERAPAAPHSDGAGKPESKLSFRIEPRDRKDGYWLDSDKIAEFEVVPVPVGEVNSEICDARKFLPQPLSAKYNARFEAITTQTRSVNVAVTENKTAERFALGNFLMRACVDDPRFRLKFDRP